MLANAACACAWQWTSEPRVLRGRQRICSSERTGTCPLVLLVGSRVAFVVTRDVQLRHGRSNTRWPNCCHNPWTCRPRMFAASRPRTRLMVPFEPCRWKWACLAWCARRWAVQPAVQPASRPRAKKRLSRRPRALLALRCCVTRTEPRSNVSEDSQARGAVEDLAHATLAGPVDSSGSSNNHPLRESPRPHVEMANPALARVVSCRVV